MEWKYKIVLTGTVNASSEEKAQWAAIGEAVHVLLEDITCLDVEVKKEK